MRRGSSLVSILGVSLALAFAGCGDGNGGNGGNGGGGGSGGNVEGGLSQLWAENARAVCKQLFSCCNGQELTDKLSTLDPTPTTQAECEVTLAVKLGGNDDRRKQAIDAGRLAFHADRGALCMQKTASASCVDYFINRALSKDPDCDATMEGMVALSGACGAAEECAGKDVVCDGADPATGTLGKCVALPGENQPCLDFACSPDHNCVACAAGLYCTFDTSICKTPLADGTTCADSGECQSGYCDATTLQCSPRLPVCDGM